jgi:hypothetical protein
MATEAIKELIAAAKIAQGWMTQPSRLAGTNMEEPCKSIHRRLGTAIDCVEAEVKPQTHEFKSFYHTPSRSLKGPCAVAFCCQPSDAPVHQIEGKS